MYEFSSSDGTYCNTRVVSADTDFRMLSESTLLDMQVMATKLYIIYHCQHDMCLMNEKQAAMQLVEDARLVLGGDLAVETYLFHKAISPPLL